MSFFKKQIYMIWKCDSCNLRHKPGKNPVKNLLKNTLITLVCDPGHKIIIRTRSIFISMKKIILMAAIVIIATRCYKDNIET